MKKWSHGELETLYRLASEKPGWVSKLLENIGISKEDEAYLTWLDDYECNLKKKVVSLEEESEESVAHQLMQVNTHINAIEREAEGYSGEERFLWIGLSELDELVSKRWKLRNKLLSKCLPDREPRISDWTIDQARRVPLYRIIPNLPKNRFILCPYHKEKSPSFKVFERGYCFGCGISVDSIRWIMDRIGIPFVEAVRRIVENRY